MKIITTLDEIYSEECCAVAIGKFDGVHLGHKKLLDVILDAKANGLKPAVFTFDPSPEALFGLGDARVLTTRDEKRWLLERIGIDLLVEYPMDRKTAAVAPEDFVSEYLVKRLKAGLIAAGDDLSYGDKGRGDFALLEQMKEEGGYRTVHVEKLRMDGEEVSSSRIRALVASGSMEAVAKLMGRPYNITGKVAHGRGIGHTIGFPTVNLYPSAEKALPPFGVYKSEIRINAERIISTLREDRVNSGKFRGITNIGVRPTVSEEGSVSAETYLYDFEGDLYDSEITVDLLSFYRPEKRFADLDALKAQIANDLASCRS